MLNRIRALFKENDPGEDGGEHQRPDDGARRLVGRRVLVVEHVRAVYRPRPTCGDVDRMPLFGRRLLGIRRRHPWVFAVTRMR